MSHANNNNYVAPLQPTSGNAVPAEAPPPYEQRGGHLAPPTATGHGAQHDSDYSSDDEDDDVIPA